MVIKRSLVMRHVSRTHRIALDWLTVNLDPGSKTKMVTQKTIRWLADQKTFSRMMSGVNFFVWWTLWIFPCFLAAIFVQLKWRPPCRREFKKGRWTTCSSKTEVSVLDFNNPEQKAILFLWPQCFQYLWKSADGFGVGTTNKQNNVEGTAGNCRQDTVQDRVQNPGNVFSILKESRDLCENSGSFGKLQQKIDIQLQTT